VATARTVSTPTEDPFLRFRLDERVAFISGATGHLGSAMSYALGRAGAHIILNSRDQSKLDGLARNLRAQDISCECHAFDMLDLNTLEEQMRRIHRLDVLINNAHTGRAVSMDDAEAIDFETAFQSAVTAAFTATRAAIPAFARALENGGGASVVNISSMYGQVSPDPALYGDSGLNSPPFYGAAKAGMIQLTRYLACHLAPKKIRVNALVPGPFPTETVQHEQPEFVGRLCQKVPLKRIGQPDELASSALFLSSDAASYITGAAIPVDGGWTAW